MRYEEATRVRVGQRAIGRRLALWLAVPTLAIAGAAVGSGPVEASDGIVPTETREVFDVLGLRCEGSDGAVAQVACRWTMPDGATGVKVLRAVVGSEAGRETVYRSADPSLNGFVDSPVRRGVRYLYAVRAFNAAGTLVAASRPVVAGVAVAPEPTIDVLRLNCSATSAVTARCGWTAPQSAARVLTLWRSVDGGSRERVASFANPFPASYGDVVPTDTSRAVYALIATDGAGQIVARSRADGVVFPSADNVVDVIDRAPASPITARPPAEHAPRPVRLPTTTIPTARPDVVNSTVPPATVPTATVPTVTVPNVTVPTSRAPAATVPDEQPVEKRVAGSRTDSGRGAPSGVQDRVG